MKMIIHDLGQEEFTVLEPPSTGDTIVISDHGKIRPCIGCFGCWIKTPGVCIIKDDYQSMGELLSKCDEIIIISRCVYGSYSPFIRNVLDRSISYLLPYFVQKNDETHHQNRYNNYFKLTVHFYGEDITKAEEKTAQALVKANGINFYSEEECVCFHQSLESIKGVWQ